VSSKGFGNLVIAKGLTESGIFANLQEDELFPCRNLRWFYDFEEPCDGRLSSTVL